MQTSLLAQILHHRPRRVLLTTYTFSVSWFETFALPALMRNGCEQIDLLVDCRRACDSTQEAASQYAGTAYRVIPVPMSGRGIFHPKIAYFEAFENQLSDILVVGSGNLTHAGQGQNLEIFDSVSNDRHPHVFTEFADFLAQFQNRYAFSSENQKSIAHFEARARLKGLTELPSDHESRSTWLIHTLRQSSSRQLANLAMATLERPDFLRVLSPYHAPSGAPIARLAADIGATDISIALSGRFRIAPFEEDCLELPADVQYVVVNTANGDRFAHAKHFEIRSSEASLLMTGSVNATVQSLETCKNIEIALVRKLPVSLFDWVEVTPTKFEPCDFQEEESEGVLLALQASWTSTNWVEGTLAPTKAARIMDMSIWDGEKRIALNEKIAVAGDGSFKVRMTTVPNTKDALVIQLEDADVCVRGWLNMEYALSGSAADRELLRSASNLLAGEYSEDELKAIFGWMDSLLARSKGSYRSGTKHAVNNQSPEGPTAPQVTTADDYDLWFQESLETNYGASTVNIARMSMAAAYAWLNRDLPTQGQKPMDEQSKLHAASNRSMASQITLLDTAKSEYRTNESVENKKHNADLTGEDLFNRMLEKVPQALQLDNSSGMAALAVELSAGQALKRTLSTPLPYAGIDRGDARYITRRAAEYWLVKFSAFNYSERNRNALLSRFCALACAALHYNPDTPPEVLNEAIQAFAQRVASVSDIEDSARLGLSSQGFNRIPSAEHAAVVNCAKRIAQATTLTEQLTGLLRDLFANGATSLAAPSNYRSAYIELRARSRNQRLGAKKFAVVQSIEGGNPRCPVCNCSISSDDMRSLRLNRYFKCLEPTCQTPIFYGLHVTELQRLGLASHFTTSKYA